MPFGAVTKGLLVQVGPITLSLHPPITGRAPQHRPGLPPPGPDRAGRISCGAVRLAGHLLRPRKAQLFSSRVGDVPKICSTTFEGRMVGTEGSPEVDSWVNPGIILRAALDTILLPDLLIALCQARWEKMGLSCIVSYSAQPAYFFSTIAPPGKLSPPG